MLEYDQILLLQHRMHDSKRLFDSTFHRLIGRWGLTENVFRILYLLYANPEGVEPAKLAELANLLRPAICPILNKLDRHKLIVRKEQSGDHRRKLITLTEKGERFVRKVQAGCLEVEGRAFAHFSPDEITNLTALFSRYTQCLLEEVKASEVTGKRENIESFVED